MACKTAEVTQILSSKRKQEKHKCFCYQTSPHTKVTFFYSGNSHAPDQTQQARETPLRARVQGQRCYMSPTQNTDQVTRLLQYQKKKKIKIVLGVQLLSIQYFIETDTHRMGRVRIHNGNSARTGQISDFHYYPS